MGVIETIFLKLDAPPLNGLLRVVLGLLLLPVYDLICRGRCPGWGFILFFVLVLLALRTVPVVFRKILPFSKAAQDIWANRRRWAKLYDSYQWQKLFWIGIGLALYIAKVGN